MKIRLMFKTPDVAEDALSDVVRDCNDGDEAYALVTAAQAVIDKLVNFLLRGHGINKIVHSFV